MPLITQSVDADFLFPTSGYKAAAIVVELKNNQYQVKVKPLSVNHQLAQEALSMGIKAGRVGMSFMEYWPLLGLKYSSGTKQGLTADNTTALNLHRVFDVDNLTYETGTEAQLQVNLVSGTQSFIAPASYQVGLKKDGVSYWSPAAGSTVLKLEKDGNLFEIDFGWSSGSAYDLNTNRVEVFRLQGTSGGSWVWRNNGAVVGLAEAKLHGLPLGASKVYYTLLNGEQQGDRSLPEFYYRSGTNNVRVSSSLESVLRTIANVQFPVTTYENANGQEIKRTSTHPVLVWAVVYFDLRTLVNVLNSNSSRFKLDEEPLYLLGTGEGSPRTPWHISTRRYRVFGLGTRLPRHPLMPLDMAGVKAVKLNGDQDSFIMDGDVLVFTDYGPHVVYFNPSTSGVSPVTTNANTNGSWSMLQIKDQLYGYEPSDYWWVVRLGGYGNELGRVNENTDAIYDATDYVYALSTTDIGLVAPKAVESSLLQGAVYPVFVGVSTLTGEFAPAFYRYAVSTQLNYYADQMDIRLRLVGLRELYNVEITDALQKLYGGVPLTDEAWAAGLMKSSLAGKFSKEPGVRFRSAMYWLAAPPDGPGMPEDEWIARYRNGVLGSLNEEIEAVLNANMLTAVERPDGGLHVISLVPYPGASHRDFINGNVPVLFYHTDPTTWEYTADPKLDVSGLEIDLEGAFAKVEVEGYSNAVSGELTWTYARFVQGGQERNYLEIDSGLWGNAAAAFAGYINQQRDSNGNLDDPASIQNTLDFNVDGFRFRVLDNGIPKAKYYPVKWYEMLGSRPDESQFYYTAGDVNWWVRFERFLYGKPTSQYATGHSLTTDDRLVLGFRAWPERNFCGAVAGDPLFIMRLKVPDIDLATLKVTPLIGKPTSTFAPRWFRQFLDLIEVNYERYPRKAKRVQNPYVGEIWSDTHAVQHEWLELIAPGESKKAYSSRDALASHLATWLTFREFLKTRRAKLRYAGFAPWREGQIVAVAAQPSVGTTVRQLSFFLLNDVQIYGQVGGEAWTEAEASFLFRLDLEKWGVRYGTPGDLLTEDTNVTVVTPTSALQLMTVYVPAVG